jgi:exo-1,4-beta-D-glucosaminidase
MKIFTRARIVTILQLVPVFCTGQMPADHKMLLRDNWAIQSSSVVKDKGEAISSADYKPENWYPATVPSTVFGTLVANKVYPDPYYGTNIESVPGYTNERKVWMPENSPFNVSWWYRKVFDLPEDMKAKNIWLNLHSINYRANIWLNGKKVADTTEIEGAYRLFELNIADEALAGKKNCLAIEIFPPRANDLSITWVDWNPTPPDRGMGIWYDISLRSTGQVAISKTRVITKLNLPATSEAKLTVVTQLYNASQENITGMLKGTIGNVQFQQEVKLEANEIKNVVFDPGEFKQLVIQNPRLWWPYTMGTPELYDLKLTFDNGGTITDTDNSHFGIREVTSWMNNFDGKHTRVFQINGKNLVIRGGGYVEDMMLRPSDKRTDIDLAYAKFMGLNALRMEAPRGSDYLFDRCDKEGILLIVGWCCCSTWERWKTWTPHTADIAEKSWKDQIVHLRNHPAVFNWLYGSDNFPPADVEQRYINVLTQNDGTRPYQSSATKDSSAIAGNTGLWMGPYPMVYAYEPPVYWYSKLEFNTEAGPAGEQIAPVESMKKMMPEQDLWPISKSWDIRLHKAFYPPARKALESRYGKPSSLEEYSMKSQVLQYEATRAMFEAFAGNKYKSSGIIYWMYNSAWPSLYWQLYDYYFAPNGAFYGTKRACEPLHIQYTYNDSAIEVVNGMQKKFSGLHMTATVYDQEMKKIGFEEKVFDLGADENRKFDKVQLKAPYQGISFYDLYLKDNTGKTLSHNFYWISSNGDAKADFTVLNNLPKVALKYNLTGGKQGDKYKYMLEIENPTTSLAFAVNPKFVKDQSRDLVLPVFWEDNYFSLMPGEKRKIAVEFNESDLGGEKPVLVVGGYNVQ